MSDPDETVTQEEPGSGEVAVSARPSMPPGKLSFPRASTGSCARSGAVACARTTEPFEPGQLIGLVRGVLDARRASGHGPA